MKFHTLFLPCRLYFPTTGICFRDYEKQPNVKQTVINVKVRIVTLGMFKLCFLIL